MASTELFPMAPSAVPVLAADAHPWSQENVARCRELLGDAVCRRLGIYALPAGFQLSVIVPVYNEAKTVAGVVDRLRATGIPMEILLVDDGSNDGTAEAIDRLGQASDVRVFHHETNRGKGAAIRLGFEHAAGDVVVIQDADLEYDPQDFRWLMQPILEGDADVVYGTRYGHTQRQVSPWWHQAVNGLITSLAGMAIGLRLSDVETCYKMIRRETLADVAPRLGENRFGIEIELTARLAQGGARFAERAIRYQHRWYDEGKKIGWRDGVGALWCIARYGLGGRLGR